jgi:hypothetical protein
MPRRRLWIYVVIFGAAILVTYFVWGPALSVQPGLHDNPAILATTSTQHGSLTIITLIEGHLADGSIYRISPDPFTGAGNFTIHDGDVGRDSSNLAGIITIEGMSDGAFSVIQASGPGGQPRDIIPRVITITNSSSESVTFGANTSDGGQEDASTNNFEAIESITYAAKFECGTIRGTEGPLRPGHYDTDIGIFNKQSFPVRVTWSAAANDNEASNALLKTLSPRMSTSIVCDDIREVTGVGEGFTEGFVIIEVPVDPRIVSSISGGSSVLGSAREEIDVLDVQIFYTANALDELPHSVLVDKISFVIHSNDTMQSIPQSMIGTVLDITLPSEIGVVSDPQEKIKVHLSAKYNMTAEEAAGIVIEIRSIDVGVGTMIDDHAISLSKVRPQANRS